MKDLIFYVLYGKPDRRYWDCIPLILVGNSLYLPSYISTFLVQRDLKGTPGADLLEAVSKLSDRVSFEYTDRKYVSTEPMAWRTMPLWAPETRFLLSRDIDSIPSTAEARAVRAFMAGGYPIHSLRAHPNHRFKFTGGLSGFNAPVLRARYPHLLGPSFDAYLEEGAKASKYPGWARWSDQDLLQRVFAPVWSETLDTAIRGALPIEGGKILTAEEYKAIDMSDVPAGAAKVFDSLMKHPGSTLRPSIKAIDAVLVLENPMSRALSEIFNRKPKLKDCFGTEEGRSPKAG